MKRQIISILIATYWVGALPAAAQQGSTAAQFLKIGVDARSSGMGQAVVAAASDVSALYWNPAGLAKLPGSSLLISHTSWIADINHDFVAFAIPLNGAALGVSLIALNLGEIEITTIEKPMGTGSYYDASDLALAFTYARQMTDRFNVGITAKYIRQAIQNEVASGIGFDIGTSLDVGVSGLKLAMALTNYGVGMRMHGDDLIIPFTPGPASTPIKAQLETREFPLPTNFRIGIAFELIGGHSRFIPSEASTLIVAADANHPIDEKERGNVGAEYNWNQKILIRGGYKFRYSEQGFSYGFGLQMGYSDMFLRLDYAQTRFGMLNTVHQFSAQFSF
ncbi:MAG: hypothetical protein D6814_09010 [Calditrichaeota bacterium]|nr:MAG: hypothetical protein D6814_09010 [Calditrichota bacterium]